MSGDANKVKYGLKNVHYAKITFTDGVPTYATPVAIPGAVNLSMSPEGDSNKFYADDSVYYASFSNAGYSGDLEVAKIPDAFYSDILGFVTDANGILVEDANVEASNFALLFEFAGDANKVRHVFYNCTCSRPNVEGATTEASKTPKTEKLSITALPLPLDANNMQITRGRAAATDTAYANWFTAVQVYHKTA